MEPKTADANPGSTDGRFQLSSFQSYKNETITEIDWLRRMVQFPRQQNKELLQVHQLSEGNVRLYIPEVQQ